ncbi:MAG: 50S ribosomal protein L28 [Patescibacteria group bacterium]|nr:50S ribosomal protein L28 [Patescibacteria group bacterium]
MSRIDELTGKRAQVGNKRSHSNIATKRKQEVNLQTIKFGGVRIRVSARTLKTIKKLANQTSGKKKRTEEK